MKTALFAAVAVLSSACAEDIMANVWELDLKQTQVTAVGGVHCATEVLETIKLTVMDPYGEPYIAEDAKWHCANAESVGSVTCRNGTAHMTITRTWMEYRFDYESGGSCVYLFGRYAT
jgi:hypothetical protein